MIELLAPAGNLEILKAAVDYGADAVYCGLSAFNARINAANFMPDEFREGARYCHHRGSKIYLTLNTLVGDAEMEDAVATAVTAYESGCDGILIQDIGLASTIHSRYPGIHLHCSTQMNVFTDMDFKSLSELGFSRVVLPREMSVREIAARTKAASRYNMETEVFAHGAVCVCYSGLCLFSAMNRSGSRSGNRGVCAQPCREEYSLLSDGKAVRKGHLLSPKDRDVCSYISDLIRSGVASLKIEGRMRDVNYVKSAVYSYRKLIDSYYAGTRDESVVKEVTDSLLVNFNRGGSYTSQFLKGKKENGFLSGEHVGKYGLMIGKITSSDSKKGTVTLKMSDSFILPDKGDYLSIRRSDKEICSFPVGKIHEMPGSIAVKGLHPDMISKLEPGLKVYLMGHKTEIPAAMKRKTDITLSVDITSGSIVCNAMINDGMNANTFAEYEVDLPADFGGEPLGKDRIVAQLNKLGDTPFRASQVYFTGPDTALCPVSLINELRRGVTDQLISELDYNYDRAVIGAFVPPVNIGRDRTPGVIRTMYTYPCVKDDFDVVEAGADIYAFSAMEIIIKAVRENIIRFIRNGQYELCILLPDLYHDEVSDKLRDAAAIIRNELPDTKIYYMDCRVFGENTKLEGLGFTHMISPGSNIHNTRSLEYAASGCGYISLSHELSTGEIKDLLGSSGADASIIVHSAGPIPWMQSDFCAVGGNKVKCGQCYDRGKWQMTGNNMDEQVTIVPRSVDCSSVIYGACKNPVDDDTAQDIADLGFDVIINTTIL